MVKKISSILSITLLIQMFHFVGINVWAAEAIPILTPDSKAAILMDVDTGTILYEKESDAQLPPASITKIMTMLLIMEGIESGSLKWEDKVKVSERAASMGGSQIFLEVGEEMTVQDMMKGIAIASGNDATVAMAEHIAGSEEKFVQMMNDKARQLGMKNTQFSNTNGLPAPKHYSSAKDIAIMSRELVKHEDVLKFTSIYEDYLRKDSDSPFWLVNTNRLVKFYDGVDGLKTGFTQESKYCLSVTAKRGNLRVIAVVMGAPTPKDRNKNITNMLNYAFSQYDSHPLFEKGDVLQTARVDKGEQSTVDLVAPRQISVLTKKGESLDLYQTTVHSLTDLRAPLQKGDVIGHVRIEKDGKVISETEILATEDLSKASLWTIFKRTSQALFGYSGNSDKKARKDG